MPSFIFPVLIVVQVVAAFTLIGLVMLQQGKGADMGSAFGGGSAGSIFGSAGASNFFSRMTKWAAIVFFVCTLGLAYIGSTSFSPATTSSGPDAGLMEQYNEVPVAPGASGSAVPTAPGAAGDTSVPSMPAAPTAEPVEEAAADSTTTVESAADNAAPSLGVPAEPVVEETPAAQ